MHSWARAASSGASIGATLLIIAVFLFSYSVHAVPSAVDGRIDLSSWNPRADGALYLSGEWEFYWSRLLSPEDFQPGRAPSPTHYAAVPGSWNGLIVDGARLKGDGYGTYRLQATLPASVISPDGVQSTVGLHLPWVFTAYRMWVNGRLAAENGTVGTVKSEVKPRSAPTTVWLAPTQEALEIVIQVSNFDHRNGGLWNAPVLGERQALARALTIRLGLDLALFGAIAFMGIYQLFHFVLFKDRKAYLYLGVTSLAIAVRILVTSEHAFDQAFPAFPWHLEIRTEYLTGYILTLSFTAFATAAFPGQVPGFVVWPARVIGWGGIACTLLLPPRTSSLLIPVVEVAISLILVYGCWRFIVVVSRKQVGSKWTLIGSVILLLTLLHDFLHYNNFLVADVDLLPFGLFALLLFQSLTMAQQAAVIYHREIELARVNNRLLDTVKRQLEEVRASRRLIAQADENLRREIAERLHGRVQSRLLLVRQRALSLKSLITKDPEASIQVARSVVQQIDEIREREIRQVGYLLHPSIVTVGLMPAVTSLANRFEEPPLRIEVRADATVTAYDVPEGNRIPEPIRLAAYRVLEEALANVHAHAKASHVTISLAIEDECLVLEVKDNGRGMDPGAISHGIGLRTIAARVDTVRGTWKIAGEVGVGATVTVRLPLDAA